MTVIAMATTAIVTITKQIWRTVDIVCPDLPDGLLHLRSEAARPPGARLAWSNIRARRAEKKRGPSIKRRGLGGEPPGPGRKASGGPLDTLSRELGRRIGAKTLP